MNRKLNKKLKMTNIRHSFAAKAALSLLGASALCIAATPANATVDLGNPYAPAGASYTITAKSGINSTNGSGGTSAGAQVNQDFEFKGTLGVAYTGSSGKNAGKQTEFGLGIYSDGGTFSTGLDVHLNQPSVASSVSITLADFDLKSTATFFNPNKVEASILVYGANNTVLFSADPAAVFAALSPSTGQTTEDYWDLNFGKLLSNAGQSSNTSISGFLLYADSTDGEKVASDPYFLVSVNGGIPVIPEPSTYVGGAVLVAFLIGMHARAVLKKKSASLA
jgi:hypothetical protein